MSSSASPVVTPRKNRTKNKFVIDYKVELAHLHTIITVYTLIEGNDQNTIKIAYDPKTKIHKITRGIHA